MIEVTFNGYSDKVIEPVEASSVVASGDAVQMGKRSWGKQAVLPTGEKCMKVFSSEDCTDESCTAVIVDVTA